jgi:hypothetical protein
MLKRPNSLPPRHGDDGEADWLLVMVLLALLVAGASAFVIGYVVFLAAGQH